MFTLQVGEYRVADELKEKLKDISVFVPTSSQEKGIDLMLCSFFEKKKIRKTLTVQVKQSRTYQLKNGRYDLFFNRFRLSSRADWYIFVGLYPGGKKNPGETNVRRFVWKNVTLALSREDTEKFLKNLRQRKKPSLSANFFGFQFDVSDKGEINIDHTRGALKDTPFSEHLLDNKIHEIAAALGLATRKKCAQKKSANLKNKK